VVTGYFVSEFQVDLVLHYFRQVYGKLFQLGIAIPRLISQSLDPGFINLSSRNPSFGIILADRPLCSSHTSLSDLFRARKLIGMYYANFCVLFLTVFKRYNMQLSN